MKERGPGRPPISDKAQEARIQIRLLETEKSRYETAAAVTGLTLSEWMRDRLNRAAKRDNRRKAN